jgi:hypothetical protein
MEHAATMKRCKNRRKTNKNLLELRCELLPFIIDRTRDLVNGQCQLGFMRLFSQGL